jgi:hypothetical protein
VPLPDSFEFLALYLISLSLQFLHFCEEFATGFHDKFPALYGGLPYSSRLFVGINMLSYALFTVAAVAVYIKGVRAVLLPVLFFVVYGVLGNAVAHPFWALRQGAYFPGFFTALPYLVLGPLLVNKLLRNRKQTAVFVGSFAAVLLITLSTGLALAR